jgi:rhodanese-related sulfurtransferase
MGRQIDADTLREWLDEERPVTVLDIRTDHARAEWWIPGSVQPETNQITREKSPSDDRFAGRIDQPCGVYRALPSLKHASFRTETWNDAGSRLPDERSRQTG